MRVHTIRVKECLRYQKYKYVIEQICLIIKKDITISIFFGKIEYKETIITTSTNCKAQKQKFLPKFKETLSDKVS